MKLTKDVHQAIPATFTFALPQEGQWCTARIRCRDGSLYILASVNLAFTLLRLVQARLAAEAQLRGCLSGFDQVEGRDGKMKPLDLTTGALGVVTRAGGLDRLDGFIRCSDKASAMSLCKSWKESAVKRGLRLAEETTAEDKGREIFGDNRTNEEKANF
jgi:hypothetical protein